MKKYLWFFLLALVIVLMLVGGLGCQTQPDEEVVDEEVVDEEVVDDRTWVLKLGNIDAVGNPAHLANEKLVELVAEKTDGRVTIELYPAGQLGGAIDQIESISMGTQEMGEFAATFYGQYIKDYNIISLAFLFEDQAHQIAFLNSDINTAIKDKFAEEYGVRIIAENWLRPPNVIATTKSVQSLEDLSGLKMRVPEIEMYLLNWAQLGTNPTVVAWGEVYLALEQGVVEGVDMPFDFIKGMKFYEPAPYVLMTNHLLTNANVIINEELWQSLPEDIQKALVEAAEEAGDYYTELAKTVVEEDYQWLLEQGVEISEVDPTPFMEKMAPLALELEGKDYWSAGLFDKIQALK
jgi:TRAP-type transport system periplasmic protein